MKKIIISLLLTLCVFSLSSCADEAPQSGYDDGYSAGYDSGYQDGISAGINQAYEEMVSAGVLKQAEIVWLSKDGGNTFHSYYCENADWEKECDRSNAESMGYIPCDSCGGNGRSVYTLNE